MRVNPVALPSFPLALLGAALAQPASLVDLSGAAQQFTLSPQLHVNFLVQFQGKFLDSEGLELSSGPIDGQITFQFARSKNICLL